MPDRPNVAIQVLAFGGSGDSPGSANQRIAEIAASRAKGRLIFAEPEVGEELIRQLDQGTGRLNRLVYRIPDPPNRRSYLDNDAIDGFARWLLEDADRARSGIVIVGNANTRPVVDGTPAATGLARLFAQLMPAPGIQQIAAIVGLPSEGGPKYKGIHWAARQMAQLMPAAGVQSVDLIGQTRHLADYAGRWLEKEYQRLGIRVRARSDQGDDADALRVWDPDSSQQWVHSEEDWSGRRLFEARLLARIVPIVHALTTSRDSVPSGSLETGIV